MATETNLSPDASADDSVEKGHQQKTDRTAEQYEAPNKKFVYDRKLEAEKEYQQGESNGTVGGDASARRNIGANGYTQRTGQKDQLENLHIGGSETAPQGGNDHETAGENASGPGFETEGNVDLSNPTRSRDQEFGEKLASGVARPAQD